MCHVLDCHSAIQGNSKNLRDDTSAPIRRDEQVPWNPRKRRSLSSAIKHLQLSPSNAGSGKVGWLRGDELRLTAKGKLPPKAGTQDGVHRGPRDE